MTIITTTDDNRSTDRPTDRSTEKKTTQTAKRGKRMKMTSNQPHQKPNPIMTEWTDVQTQQTHVLQTIDEYKVLTRIQPDER